MATPKMTAAASTNAFRRPVRSDSRPPASEAATTSAGCTRVARNTCCGTSSLLVPTRSSRKKTWYVVRNA